MAEKMIKKTFLVEIGTEELPPRSLRALAEQFASNFKTELKSASLSYGQVMWFATPRRLALKIIELNTKQPDREEEKRGPAIAASFDQHGLPTKAAESWARSCGIQLKQAERLKTHKGEWLFYRAQLRGESAQNLLPNLVKNALERLSAPKMMRWGTQDAQFLRPVHTLTLLLDGELLPATLLGITSSRILQGHRFLGEQTIKLDHAEQYPEILCARGKVLADYEKRKAKIKTDVENAACHLGGHADLDDVLLEEVTSLVEWPVALTAKFEKKFLDVPQEALVHTMKKDQKYFPIYDDKGNLLPYFVFIANIDSKDPKQVVAGNEKVVRPRLTDAAFFFKTDCKTRLENHLPALQSVMFHPQLGSLGDRTERIQMLTAWIARQIGADTVLASRAGLLSKCDLMTHMVFEYPDTQGVMGMHYARHDGEPEDVALALNEQYRPRFSGDRLPSGPIACCLAIADKMDTLIGILGVGQQPKGDKDPFGLRRAALGVLRILIEKNLPLDLRALAEETVCLFGGLLVDGGRLSNPKVINDVIDFFLARLRAWYQESGHRVDVIQAVLFCRPTCPVDIDAKIKAVTHFRTLPQAATLAAANKRVANILAKSDDPLNNNVNVSLLKEKEEIQLAAFVTALDSKLQPWLLNKRFREVLIELAGLHEAIDNFFDKVMVNVDERKIRINRLTLLSQLNNLFLQVADISLLQW